MPRHLQFRAAFATRLVPVRIAPLIHQADDALPDAGPGVLQHDRRARFARAGRALRHSARRAAVHDRRARRDVRVVSAAAVVAGRPHRRPLRPAHAALARRAGQRDRHAAAVLLGIARGRVHRGGDERHRDHVLQHRAAKHGRRVLHRGQPRAQLQQLCDGDLDGGGVRAAARGLFVRLGGSGNRVSRSARRVLPCPPSC